jgi:hypothetical protein
MLGVPARPDAFGVAALLLGLLAAGAGTSWLRARIPRDAAGAAAAFSLALIVAVFPYLVWRIVEDMRYTTRLTAYDASAMGPVQAYLAPYLLDGVPKLIPPGDSYTTVTGPGVPFEPARKAFPALAIATLFPRRLVDRREADWVVAWGIPPSAAAPVGRVVVVRRASGDYPALTIARVRR